MFPTHMFKIVNLASGLVLDINERNQSVQLWSYNGGRNQQWQYDFTTRAIFNPSTGKALDLDAKDGMTLIMWKQNRRPNQEWIMDPSGNTIVNPATRKVLDIKWGVIKRGTTCIAYPRRDGAPNQQWELHGVPPDFPSGWFGIKPGHCTRCGNSVQNAGCTVSLCDCGSKGMAPFSVHAGTFGIHFLQSKAAALTASATDVAFLVNALGGSHTTPPMSFPDAKLLDRSARLSLMQYIDGHRQITGENSPDVVLSLSIAELRAAVGGAAVQRLVNLFGMQPAAIRLRRVEARGDAATCVAFHTDYTNALVSLRTMQVPLNEPSEYDGGELVWAVDGALEVPSRASGSATLHSASVVHGVTAMARGQRYSLFLLELPDRK